MTPRPQISNVLLVQHFVSEGVNLEPMISECCDGPVTRVYSLGEALHVMDGAAPDMILFDLAVGVDPEQCIAVLRNRCPTVPIVVLARVSDEENAYRCLDAGAQDYVAWEMLRPEILRRVMAYAAARENERAARDQADAFEKRLAAIVEASRDAILSTDAGGRIESWNRGAETLFQVSRDEAIGRHLSKVIVPPEEDRDASGYQLINVLTADPQPVVEVTRMRKDGARIELSASASPLQDASGRIVGISAVLRDITEKKRSEELLQARNEELLVRERQLETLLRRLHTIREEERTRISREFHDELGQLLTAVKLNIHWVGRRCADFPSGMRELIADRIHETDELLDRTVESIRKAVVQLRPTVLDAFGLPAAIREESRQMSRRAEIPIEVDIDVDAPPAGEAATVLFRIFQELLTNALRHSSASWIGVRLAREGEMWIVQVEDNGVGFDPDAMNGSKSFGLLGVRERAKVMGGDVDIGSRESGGAIATARIFATARQD